RKQADIAKVLARFSDVTKAVVGLGAWGAGRSTIYDAMTVKDRRALNAAGVVADVSGVFLDAEGHVVGRDQTARLICMDAAQLASVDEVFAVPYGVEKAPAVLAAARSGLVTSMVTHDAMARKVLGMPAV
ncbi:MAG: sugar-binding domain-containing protein, partial [Actinomycetota bacterium]|nr:sugar-binding domain-containing protein [Actinomycetota bacterium]